MMLEVCWDGLWTLSFGLSQFHGHGSRLVCEVALRLGSNQDYASYTYILKPKGNQPMLFPWKREHIGSAHLIIGINYHGINFQPIRGLGDCLGHNGIGPMLRCIA